MKKLLFLGACLVALASQPVVAQTGTPEVAVLSFYHNASGRLFATIVHGKGTPEKQDTKGSWDEEAQFQQQVIAKLYQEGCEFHPLC